jgi:hypothetical protein
MNIVSPASVPIVSGASTSPDAPQGSTAVTPLPQRILTLVDAHRRTLFAFLLFLYVIGFNGQWRVERDSALYLSVGRNLAEGRGYTYQGQPQRLVFPGLPLIFAGTFKVFGADRLWPALVLMLLMGFATLGLTYRLFLLHAGRPTAVLMTVGLGATRLFYRYCFELLSDLPFLLGVMAFLAGYEAIFGDRRRKAHWSNWLLLFAGLLVAMATRPTMWALLLSIFVASAWLVIRSIRLESFSRMHVVLLVAVVAAAVAFPLFDLRREHAARPEYEDDLLRATSSHLPTLFKQAVTENIPQLCESTLAKALFGCPIGPGMNTLAAILVICLGIWLLRYRVLWGLWVLTTIAMLLVFKPLDRYLLPVLPLLVFAWWRWLVWLHGRLPHQWADVVFLGLLVGGGATNLARLGQMVVEQRRVPFLAHYHEGRYVSLYEVAKLVRHHTGATDRILVGAKEARVIGYVSRRDTFKLDDPAPPLTSSAKVFVLLGPAWNDSRTSGRAPEDVASWIERRQILLGPPLGVPIQHPPEKEPWRLYRVLNPYNP